MVRFWLTLTLTPCLLLCLLSILRPTKCASESQPPSQNDLDPDDPNYYIDIEQAVPEDEEKMVEKRWLQNVGDADHDVNIQRDVGASGRSSKSKKRKFGKVYSEQDFAHFWPPRREDGTEYPLTEAGQKEWEALLKKKNDEYLVYEAKKKELLKQEFGDKEFQTLLDNLPRAYPYCVDGFLPFLDRHKLEGQTFTKKNPACIPGMKAPFPPEDCIDNDLRRFIPLFESTQPLDEPIIADPKGKPAIKHIVGGAEKGSYIVGIHFSKIYSPPPPVGIRGDPPHGSRELPFWMHIIVQSRVKLEGLYMQAIGSPMGLPFGNFRDDFDCNPGHLSKHSPKQPVNSHRKKAPFPTTVVPCKYSHGNNNGDMYPNVYAYGGRSSSALESKDEFRFHFSWSSLHCNLKIRVQFLVMAVESFKSANAEAFLTSTYILNQNNAAGSPPPYISGSADDMGWDGGMECDESMVKNAPSTDPSEVILEYRDDVGKYPIPYDGDYENCTLQDEDMTNFIADKIGPGAVKAASINYEIARKMQQICPPSNVCLNQREESDPLGVKYDENGQPINPDAVVRKIATGLKDAPFPKCKLRFCRPPNETVPMLYQEGIDDEEGEDAKWEAEHGGTHFSPEFTRDFFKSGALHFRKTHGTHVWCMTLAWFILMALGVFTARYYKETGGINANTRNSILGLGYWIWVHIVLFFLSLTFMWVGILETSRFRQKPISCNLMEQFGDIALKNFCRWKKRIVRHHRKIGIAAVSCYHIALAISWARPARKIMCGKCLCKIPFRKIFVWVHVIFAYVGKLLCIASVFIFFSPIAQAICKQIPTFLAITEIVSIIFFVVGWVLQCLEDCKLKRTKRIFPVLEAQEPADESPCYWYKVGLVILSVVIHVIMFGLLAMVVNAIYFTPGKGTDKPASFEDPDHGIGGKCNLISSKTDLDASMDAYFFRKKGNADTL